MSERSTDLQRKKMLADAALAHAHQSNAPTPIMGTLSGGYKSKDRVEPSTTQRMPVQVHGEYGFAGGTRPDDYMGAGEGGVQRSGANSILNGFKVRRRS